MFTDSWAVANEFAGWSGTGKEHGWKMGEEGRHLGKKFVDGSLQTDEGWKILMHPGKKHVARSLHMDEGHEETLVPHKCSSESHFSSGGFQESGTQEDAFCGQPASFPSSACRCP